MRQGPRRQRPDAPIAITSVAPSLDDQHDARKRKYLIMMGLRVVCLLAAVATYSISLWLALGFIVGMLVLPWSAVLIANDRPPRHRTAFVRYHAPRPGRELGPGSGHDLGPGSGHDLGPGSSPGSSHEAGDEIRGEIGGDEPPQNP